MTDKLTFNDWMRGKRPAPPEKPEAQPEKQPDAKAGTGRAHTPTPWTLDDMMRGERP